MPLGKTRHPPGGGLEMRSAKASSVPKVFGVTRLVPVPQPPARTNFDPRALGAGTEPARSESHPGHGDPSSLSNWDFIPSEVVSGAGTALALPDPHPRHPSARAPTGSVSGQGGGGEQRAGAFEEPMGFIPWHERMLSRGSSSPSPSWSLP